MERRIISFRRRREMARRRRKRQLKYFWLFIFVLIGVFYFSQSRGADEANVYPVDVESGQSSSSNKENVAGVSSFNSSDSPASRPSSSPSPAVMSKSLQETVEKSLEGTTATYAVVIKNLKTGESFSMNESRHFDAGSLYKLWTMAVVMREIEKGELEEDAQLSQGIAVLNRKFGIDPELAEQTKGTITLTVAQALKQMITISHNYAALLLTEKVKLSTVAAYLKEKGFNDSKVGTDGSAPTTTALEMSKFFERLYKGELADSASTGKMLELLKNQQLRNKLPKYLDPNVEIAHKTGEIGWFSHDAGIVYTEKGDYIIVVMSESPSPKGAEERIAKLSQDIHSYFKNKSL